MRHWLIPAVFAISLLLSAGFASPTTIIPPTFEELISKAALIFQSEVVNQRSAWEQNSNGRRIVTLVDFDVLRVLKGQVGLRTQLTFLGGSIDDITLNVADIPVFHVGDRDVLFVSADQLAVSPLVGFSYGRFRLIRDPATGIDTVYTHDHHPLSQVTDVGKSLVPTFQLPRPLSVTEFASAVQQRISAQNGR